MKICNFYKTFVYILFMMTNISTLVSAATITTYTDRASWENALSGFNITDETFDGPASNFGPNSSGNIIGDFTIDIIGHNGDPTRQGLTGTGFLEGEVDSSNIVTSDGAKIRFNLTTFGFALVGLKDNAILSPNLNIHEFGIEVLGQSFLLSDVLGLTGPTDTSAPDAQAPFVGFVSDMLLTSFNLVHGNLVRPVEGGNEDFLLDGLAYSSASPISEPGIVWLIGIGLIGLIGMRRKASKSIHTLQPNQKTQLTI